MEKRIHDFEGFTRIFESKGDGTSIVIGDSGTPIIAGKSKFLTLLGNIGSERSLWKVGMGVKWLKDAVSRYPVDSDVKNVAIKIGTNGGFNKSDDIKGLMTELRRVFPSARFFALQGSWGWGNNVGIKPDKVKAYYDKFRAEGVNVIDPPVGEVADPHVPSLPVYTQIATNLDKAITNQSGYSGSADLTTGKSVSQIISRPGDPYKYKVENDQWLAKKDSQSRWYELTGADFKPAYQISIDILDKENPNMRSKNAPKKSTGNGGETPGVTPVVDTTPVNIKNLPIKLTGSYKVPKNTLFKADALHSFDRRKSDGFGGYMLRGGPIPSKWSSYVKLDQGKGINQVLNELIGSGVKADVTEIKISVNDDYSVNWEATIDKSKDGNAYSGVASRGSAGLNADDRALRQISKMKSDKPNAYNWKQVLDLNVKSPVKIRQYFFKYSDKDVLPELPNE